MKNKDFFLGRVCLSLILILHLVIISSCKNEESTIFIADLTDIIKVDSNEVFPKLWDPFNMKCNKLDSIQERNLPYDFEGAIEDLKSKFRIIEEKKLEENTSTYIKSLILADFVYSAFSFELLGPKFGLTYDSSFFQNIWSSWDTMPLSVCYYQGNTNEISVYCAQRTSFFLRMADTLLNVKGRANYVTNSNHVFPIVTIGNREFIIDPYDPFVLCDTISGQIVDYTSFLNHKEKDFIIPIRTKRVYGNTRQIVSKPFVAMLQRSYSQEGTFEFCNSLKEYFKKNEKILYSTIKPCFGFPEDFVMGVFKSVKSLNYIYSIEMTGRVDGVLIESSDVQKYYSSEGCNQL